MCFTNPVKYSYFYFATLFPITQGKQTVTESILTRKTIRDRASLWLPWWHNNLGECLLANPRAMQMRKRHKIFVRILLRTLRYLYCLFLPYWAFPVKRGLACSVSHERFPLISLRKGSGSSPETILQARCKARFSGLPLCILSYRVTASYLRDNCYVNNEGRNAYRLISQCIPLWFLLTGSRDLQDWNAVYYIKDDPQNTTSWFFIAVIYTVPLPKRYEDSQRCRW